MKRYKITAGTFRQPDNTLLTVGDSIDLDAADAAAFKHQLEPLPETKPAPERTVSRTSKAD